MLVETLCEVLDRVGVFRKFYHPLVSAFGVSIHEDGCRRIFAHLRPCLLTGILQAAFSIILDKFFAKGVDKIFCATRDDKLIRVALGKHHGVAYHVAPQSARRADHHGIVDALFHTPQGHSLGVGASYLFQGDKFVEHIIVRHQQHRLIVGVVLYAEETF